MVEVFISYGRKNRDLVEPIATRLEELGVEKWIDSGIPTGERYRKEIRGKLKDAKAVLVCWSPEALDSEWVDYEAEVADSFGTYVPAFIAPCVLEPPFSGYQTADLSNWKGEATDSNWLALVERIAEKIGREGVAAAARARASSDEHAQYDFAKRYPEEPVARKIWLVWETRHREVFNQRTVEAREKVRSRINAETVDLEARLAEARPAFEAWLADERRGAARELIPIRWRSSNGETAPRRRVCAAKSLYCRQA